MSKNSEEIKDYWENRAASDASAQSTTMDIWLRHIEAEYLKSEIGSHNPQLICDIGCGDGLTTINCAKAFLNKKFFGFDYSKSMIKNAEANKRNYLVDNVEFLVSDVTNNLLDQKFDFLFTTRCLINLENWDAQKDAISRIYEGIAPGGIYLMIENFQDSHNQFNSVRKQFGLPEIDIRDHNCFFHKPRTLDFLEKKFEVIKQINISSSYYLVSRIIYSSICLKSGVKPDYNDIHHQLAANLPFVGEYGPVRALTLRKPAK